MQTYHHESASNAQTRVNMTLLHIIQQQVDNILYTCNPMCNFAYAFVKAHMGQPEYNLTWSLSRPCFAYRSEGGIEHLSSKEEWFWKCTWK